MRHTTRFLILGTTVLSLFFAPLATPHQNAGQPNKSKLNAEECNWLLSNLNSGKVIPVGQGSLFVSSETVQKLDALRTQLTSLGAPGVVVYAPVIAGGKLTMMRMEGRSAGEAPLLQAHKTAWNEQTFRLAITAAQQPGGEFFKRDLHRQLLADHSQDDLGKSIFIFDPESYGIAPQALGLKDSVIVASPDFGRALANLHSLKTARVAPSKFAAILGLPANEADFNSVFGNSTTFGDLAEWQSYNREALEVSSSHGVKVLTGSQQVAAKSKVDLLREIEKQAGIVFIVAHAEGARIILPGGKTPIDISPSDIANLHLRENPFVVLRVCQGDDHGFANAFLKAGAVGVWSNRGVIRADVAIEQVRLFLEHLGTSGNTIDAIVHVMSQNPNAAASSTLFTELMGDFGGALHEQNR